MDDENTCICFDDDNPRLKCDPLFECWIDIQVVAVQIGVPLAL